MFSILFRMLILFLAQGLEKASSKKERKVDSLNNSKGLNPSVRG
jgi:hypothetical protein